MGNKALKVLVFIGCFSFQGIAQSIPIQLMVVDSDGFEKVNHAVKLRLTLTNDTSNTTGQYQEVHLTQSNDFGMVSESLGGGVVTTNSSVYALSEFAFNVTEPMIKIELDTTALSNQYYTVGTLAYTYPLVARRALRSDSADYSSLSLDAEYADTAEYARNFDESLDNDTSSQNEIQLLDYNEQDKTITISKGNSIEIGSNSGLQVDGYLMPVANNTNWYNWSWADSTYLYANWGTNLSKALISNPDSIITDVNAGFTIKDVFLRDSLIIGVDDSYNVYSIYACGLDGSNTISKYIGPTSENIYSNSVSVKDSIVSYIGAVYSTKFHYKWDLRNNTITSSSIYGTHSNDFVFDRDYQSNSGYKSYSINRWDGTTFSFGIDFGSSSQLNYYGFIFPDSSGTKVLKKSTSYPYSSYGFYDSAVYKGTFAAYGANLTYKELSKKGYGVASVSKSSAATQSDYTKYKQVYLMNLNNIGTESTVSKLILDDWESHPENSGSSPSIVEGFGEILIIFSNVKNFWIDGAYRSGSFIYRVPLN